MRMIVFLCLRAELNVHLISSRFVHFKFVFQLPSGDLGLLKETCHQSCHDDDDEDDQIVDDGTSADYKDDHTKNSLKKMDFP